MATVDLSTDPNFREGKANWQYDEEKPELLLGKTLSVHWPKMNLWYYGTIDSWDSKGGIHRIMFEDGDQRWVRMRKCTFSIKDEPGHHIAEKCDKYQQPEFRGYTPKKPDSKAKCVFHAMLDAGWLPDGSLPIVCGSLPVMGGWEDGKGVPMAQSETNPRMFRAEIDLPFGLGEFSNSGIFDYKICIRDAEGKVHPEGGLNRRVGTCNPHYYSVLCPNDGESKALFDGYNQPTVEDVCISTMQADFADLLAGRIKPRDFVSRCHYLHGSYKMLTRDQGEEIIGKGIKLLDESKSKPPLALFCLLASVGFHGVSRFKRLTRTKKGVEDSKSLAKLKPSPWCSHVLKNLNIELLMKLDLKGTLGPYHHYCTTGVREAAERAMNADDFSWIRVAPLLKEKKVLPQIVQQPDAVFRVGERVQANFKNRGSYYAASIGRVNASGTYYILFDDGDKEDNVEANRISKINMLAESYDKAYKDILAVAIETINTSQALIASGVASGVATDSKSSDSKEKKESNEEIALRIGHDTLWTLVTYAPCTASLSLLFTKDFVIHLKKLVPAIAEWVTSANWSVKDLEQLEMLLAAHGVLRSPRIAESLLNSESCAENGDVKFVKQLRKITIMCGVSCPMTIGDDEISVELLAKYVRLERERLAAARKAAQRKEAFHIRRSQEVRLQNNPSLIISKLNTLRSWHQILTGGALSRVEPQMQSALSILKKTKAELASLKVCWSGAGVTSTSTSASPKSMRALSNAETKVRSILARLENSGVTVNTASDTDMDELEAATTARDDMCATELQSAERALESILSALEKPDGLLKEAASARDKTRDATSSARLMFEHIGGVWTHIGSKAITSSSAPDWNAIMSEWSKVSAAYLAEHKASAAAMDDKVRGNALETELHLYDDWLEAKNAFNRAIISANRVYETQRQAVVDAARQVLWSILSLETEAGSILSQIQSSVQSETKRLRATQRGLERLIARARALKTSKKSAEQYEEKYFKIEDEKRALKSALEDKQNAYNIAVRRRQRSRAATLKKDVTKAEKSLREFVQNPENKSVVRVLLSLSNLRPELSFYNSGIDPFAGASNRGRRVRNFDEYDNVAPLFLVDCKDDSTSSQGVCKLYSATVAADDGGQDDPSDAKGSGSQRGSEKTRLDAVIAAVTALRSQGINQAQIIQQLRKTHSVKDILAATQLAAATAVGAVNGDAEVPQEVLTRKSVPCILKAFDGNRVLKDLRRAVHVMGNMSHPNVIKLQGVCRDDRDGRWLVQLPQYSCNLWKWVLQERNATMNQPGASGRTPAETWQGRCARMLGGILRGLDYLHSRGVVHRDLKPQNVLVGPPLASIQAPAGVPSSDEEYPVICDFETCAVEELNSDTTTTRVVISLGYVDKRLKDGQVCASPETDMYSFGIVMGEALLGRRLDVKDPIHDITNSKDAKDNTSTEQRDIIVSLLCDPEQKDNSHRPTAAELLRLPFFSSGPAAIRRCLLCYENKPLEQGVQCCKPVDSADDGKGDAMSLQPPHFMCSECFSGYVTSEATNHSNTCIACPATAASEVGDRKFIKCRSPPFADDVIAAHASRPAFDAYMKAKVLAAETDAERRAEVMLKLEMEKIRKMDAKQREIYSTRKHIVNTLLVDVCPRCRLAVSPPNFAEECFALYCQHRNCGCGFCAWCFKDCGSDAHRHVANCEHNLEGGNLFSTEAKFLQARATRLTRAVRAYLTERPNFAKEAVRECADELKGAGLQDIVNEYS